MDDMRFPVDFDAFCKKLPQEDSDCQSAPITVDSLELERSPDTI